MRRLVGLLVLLALLVVADRAAAGYAGRTLAGRLRSAAGLSAAPTVRVTGFPFLTQAVLGRYDRVEVAARDVPAGDAVLNRLDVVLTGARVGLSDAATGRVSAVPVEQVRAQASLAYDDLSRSSGRRRLSVRPEGDRLRVTGAVDVLGRTLTAAAISRVELDGDAVRVTAEQFRVGNAVADDLLSRALAGRFDLRVRIRDLPYGLTVRALTVTPDALVVRAAAEDTVLRP